MAGSGDHKAVPCDRGVHPRVVSPADGDDGRSEYGPGTTDTARRGLARIPADVTHRERWRLAPDILDSLADWGIGPPVVVADAAHGPTHSCEPRGPSEHWPRACVKS
ncbi:transposase [Streptomyces scabiei]|uniref:transposase n=1 Tax=Streptomyces scabiei TaxID=1930 RepID=UPI00367CDAAA